MTLFIPTLPSRQESPPTTARMLLALLTGLGMLQGPHPNAIKPPFGLLASKKKREFTDTQTSI